MEDQDMDFTEDHTEDFDGPEAIKNLRAANKRAEERAKAAEGAVRKLAFLEAGLNPKDNPQVELFIKAYDGELTTEAITAEAAKYRLISEPVESDEVSDFEVDQSQTRARQSLGANSFDPGAPVSEGDPMGNAYAEFHKLRREGATSEEASVAVLGKIFEQARNGNAKFVFDSDSWQGSESARSR